MIHFSEGQFNCFAEFLVEMDFRQDIRNYKLKMLPKTLPKILPRFRKSNRIGPQGFSGLRTRRDAKKEKHLFFEQTNSSTAFICCSPSQFRLKSELNFEKESYIA